LNAAGRKIPLLGVFHAVKTVLQSKKVANLMGLSTIIAGVRNLGTFHMEAKRGFGTKGQLRWKWEKLGVT
jgi:hypothetical protein